MKQNTEEKRVQKSKTPFRLQKIDHRTFWICLGKEKTDTEMKKKEKEEGRKEEWDQEQKREKKNELNQILDTQKRQWRKNR